MRKISKLDIAQNKLHAHMHPCSRINFYDELVCAEHMNLLK